MNVFKIDQKISNTETFSNTHNHLMSNKLLKMGECSLINGKLTQQNRHNVPIQAMPLNV